jgi:aspartate beta-hydroxylase
VLLFDVFRHDQPFWLIGLGWLFLWGAQLWQHVQRMRQRALLKSDPGEETAGAA